jgi:glucokinase
MILAGDIGGTKVQLALYDEGADARKPVRDGRLASRDHATLADGLRAFLGAPEPELSRVVLGVAGPVVDGRCVATNLPWTVEAAALSAEFGEARVELINDLEATAWGIGVLGEDDLLTLQRGADIAGNRALIAAGTGLGEGVLVHRAGTWTPTPSEGGHCDFAPRDHFEDGLLLWLRRRHGHVSYERVLSGPGLADLHRFLRETGRGEEPEAWARRFDAAEDPAAVVTEAAADGCPRARLALERFVSIYGAEAANLALKTLALGGVYVAGGIAPRLLPLLREGGFLRGFRDKGRLGPLLERIPVRVVLDPRAPLWGAARVALGDA